MANRTSASGMLRSQPTTMYYVVAVVVPFLVERPECIYVHMIKVHTLLFPGSPLLAHAITVVPMEEEEPATQHQQARLGEKG